MSKANKLLKECKGLVDTQTLTMKNIEMIFAKVSSPPLPLPPHSPPLQVKGASGRGLDYAQTLEFFYHVGCMKFYGIDASSIVASSASRAATPPPPSATSSSRPDTTSRKNRHELIQRQHDTIQSSRFGRYRGKNAVTIRFVYECASPLPSSSLTFLPLPPDTCPRILSSRNLKTNSLCNLSKMLP
jgi:hypothetical protein